MLGTAPSPIPSEQPRGKRRLGGRHRACVRVARPVLVVPRVPAKTPGSTEAIGMNHTVARSIGMGLLFALGATAAAALRPPGCIRTIFTTVCPTPCGGNQEPECASGSPCAPGYTPNLPGLYPPGVCVPCGGDEEPLCASGSECALGYTPVYQPCFYPRCFPCGGAWEIECEDGIPCAPGFYPEAEFACAPCGGACDFVCEPGSSCGPGSTAQTIIFCVPPGG